MTDTHRQKLCSGAITFIKQAFIPSGDPLITLGASITRDATAKLQDKTITLLLLQSFIENGLKQIKAGTHPIAFKKNLAEGIALTLTHLSRSPLTLTDPLITEALQKEIVLIENGTLPETTLSYTSGLELNSGYLSSYFCTRTDPLVCEMHNVAISTIEKKISSPQEIILLLQNTKSPSHLIIAPDITDDALSTLIINQLRGTLKVCVIKKDPASLPYKSTQKAIITKDKTILCIPELATSNIAIVRIGGLTQAEIKEKRHLFEINLSAAKEGVAYLPMNKTHFVLDTCSSLFARPKSYRRIEESLQIAFATAEKLLLSKILI